MTLKHPTPGIGYFKIDHREVSEVDLIVTKRDGNNRPLTGWKNEYGAGCLQRSEAGVVLRIWLIQGKEKRLLARILEILEKARKRLSRQNSTIKVRKCEEKRPEFYKEHLNLRNYNVLR